MWPENSSDDLLLAITGVVNLFLDGRCPLVLSEYIASAPLTPLVKPGGGIRPIAVGTIWRRLVSKVGAALVGPSLAGYFAGLQFGVGVPNGGEAILHALNRLVEARGGEVGLSMLLVDFQNAFNMVDRGSMLEEVRSQCPSLSRWVEFCYIRPARLYYGEYSLRSCRGVQQGDPLGPLLFSLVLHPLVCKIRDTFDLQLHAWYLDDGTIVGDTLEVAKVLNLILQEGPLLGLSLNVDKTELFWPTVDPRGFRDGVFPHGIARPSAGVTVLGGPVTACREFGEEVVARRVSKTLRLMDLVARLQDPQCELLLLRACTGISKLYFTLRTCPPHVFAAAQDVFDKALRVHLERIVTASGPGFGDWQWRQATLPFHFGGLGVYCAGDVVHYAFIASRLQSAALQSTLLESSGLTALGPAFDDALVVFNETTDSEFLRAPCEVAATKLMKKLADIYFTQVVATSGSVYSLTPRQVALWKSQMGPHCSDWLRVVPISGLGQTMNMRSYRCVLCYRLGIPMFSISGPCPACKRVFGDDSFGDHAVSCPGVVGIKHRHNLVRDTLYDICYRLGITIGREVDIGLTTGAGGARRTADLLFYKWASGKDTCVDVTGSSPLTHGGLASFVPGRVVAEAAQRKRDKYRSLCVDAGYEFLPFSFSTFGELDVDAVELLRRLQSVASSHDEGLGVFYLFSRIGFSIARGVGAQLVSRLPTNFL